METIINKLGLIRLSAELSIKALQMGAPVESIEQYLNSISDSLYKVRELCSKGDKT